jgi:hypothetical protein
VNGGKGIYVGGTLVSSLISLALWRHWQARVGDLRGPVGANHP